MVHVLIIPALTRQRQKNSWDSTVVWEIQNDKDPVSEKAMRISPEE